MHTQKSDNSTYNTIRKYIVFIKGIHSSKQRHVQQRGVLVSAHQNSIYPVPATQSLVSAAALLNTPLNLLKVSSKTNDSNRNHAL